MKLIIAGGRDFNDRALMISTLQELVSKGDIPNCPELVCGMAKGADIMAWQLWNANHMPIHEFKADWDTYGKSAGYRRNVDMGKFADIAICFWDGKSKGTKHMIDIMKLQSKPVYVVGY